MKGAKKGIAVEDPLQWIAIRRSFKQHLDNQKRDDESYNDVLNRLVPGARKVARRNGA